MKYDATDIPDTYDRARRLPEETITLWIDSILRHIQGTSLKTIVDLGCGTGRFTIPLYDRFKSTLVGIDPSWKMLEKARATSGRIRLIQGSAEHVPLKDGAIDMVYCSQVYHHMQDKHAALDEIHRILQPNGFLCIRNSTIENLDSLLHLKFFPRAYKDDHTLLPLRQEVFDLAADIGFLLKGHEILRQKFAHTRTELIDKIRLRGLSDLAAIPDSEFKEGLQALEAYCTKAGSDIPVYEDMDLFVFRRA